MKSLNAEYYYRLSTMFRGVDMDLGIINGGSFNNMPRLEKEGNFSGQYWIVTPAPDFPEYYRLSTMFRGVHMCLDVFNGGEYNNMLHLVEEANFSGQYWKIEPAKDYPDYYRLSTMHRGPSMDLDVINGGALDNMPKLVPQGNFSGQYWKIEATNQKVVPGDISSQPGTSVNLQLVNNTPEGLNLTVCGMQIEIGKGVSQRTTLVLPTKSSLLITAVSNNKKLNFSLTVNTGFSSSHSQEYDYAVGDQVNVFQHVGPNQGGAREMTINFGPAFSSTSWMGLLDITPETTLADITIPGTHDTATWNGTRASKCQTLKTAQQLEYGIRWFDLRLAVNGDDLEVWHGIEAQGIYLAKDILPVIKDYLAKHSSETVIICVNNVSWPHNRGQFDKKLHGILMNGVEENKLYVQPQVPKLQGLGGCVVLMRQDADATFGIDASTWPDDSKDRVQDKGKNFWYSVQNVYKFGPDYLSAKWRLVKAQLDCAGQNVDGNGWYFNFTSASRAPITDPIDIAIATDDQGINYKLHNYLCEQVSPKYFGTLPIDFPEAPAGLIKLLISMNKFK